MMKNPKIGFEMPEKAAAKEPIAVFTSSLRFKPNQSLKNISQDFSSFFFSCSRKSGR